MKTYTEALEATLMRTGNPGDKSAVMTALAGTQELYSATVEEVQEAEETQALAICLIRIGKEQGMSLAELVVLAFSHGVMVGIEMEKPE
jgi:hypothetical protein